MNKILETLKREWERSILLFLILSLLGVVGYFAYDYLNREEEEAAAKKGKAALPSYYDISLLTPADVKSLQDGVNPMSCVFEKPPRPKPLPFQRPKPVAKPGAKPAAKPAAKPGAKPAAKSGAKPAAKPGAKPAAKPSAKPAAKPGAKSAAKPGARPSAKPSAKPVVKPSPKPAPKPRPKRKRVFEFCYVGNMSISGGSSGAQLYVSERISKKQQNRFKTRLHAGEKLFDGLFEVVEFDKYKVVLRHSGAKRFVVPMRAKKRTITLEVYD